MVDEYLYIFYYSKESEFINTDKKESNRLKEPIYINNSSVEGARDGPTALEEYNESIKLSEQTTKDGKNIYKGQKAYHKYLKNTEAQLRAGKYNGRIVYI